ncbi:S-adenosyl-L-methionine-dependent methyltransferase [Stipitochalara longipes BDJ]|nr:S-adenosyl-L-methionine-dependent methyltransferase [Stipitochalara longipes BDJ]
MALDPAQTSEEGSHAAGRNQNINDTDSAIGDDDERSFTTSLATSIRQYRIENGRTYHGYKDGQYPFPNDEKENDRLDLQHHLFRLTMDEKLYLSPIKDDVQNVLDIGTGTGLWAIDFGDEHPSAAVIGTDLSPIQATFVPPNVSFLVDDAKEPWVFKEKFDFIHARQLHCVVEEQNMFRQAFENLKPGGWLEMQELAHPIRNDDGTLTPEHTIYKWSHFLLEATRRIGSPCDNPTKYAEWMREAGFVNVQEVIYKWPSNPWPKDKKHKTLGLWNLANLLDGVEGFTMAMFTRILGWQPQEVETFLVGVRADSRNLKIHNWYPIHVVYGQKPE